MNTIIDNAQPCKRKIGGQPVPLHSNPILAAEGFSETFLERFWAKVNKTESCWLWTASVRGRGYGRISRGSPEHGPIAAHIASWIIHFGTVPNGLLVLHDCPEGDCPRCVNPNHLWLGTNDENMSDMVEKGRSCFGEKNVNAILTAQSVLEIRRLHAEKAHNQRVLAKMFGVDFSTIHYILNRKNWAHI